MDYATLPLTAVRHGLEEVARDAHATFGRLDAAQLNWKPDPSQWSVAQCFDHLLSANRQMLQSADDAMAGRHPRTMWQRLPLWPRVTGRLLIRSQAPENRRKFKAPPPAQPSTSDIPADVIQRFVAQHHDALARLAALDEARAAGVIMPSPFVSAVTYSVLDGWRLMFAHDRRHVAQARRVIEWPGFPRPASARSRSASRRDTPPPCRGLA
jgi:hypothetical protein